VNLELAKQMRDGFKQGGYKKEMRVMNALIKAAENLPKKPVKSDTLMELVDETLAEMERVERYERLK
jgi:hypothetical protein